MNILRVAGLVFLTLILWLTTQQYFFCPQFLFEEPQPFQGSQFYNPYEKLDSSQWTMCNFHAHAAAWSGLTDGKGTPIDIWKTYDSLGYAIHLVSDYHKVDHAHENLSTFIPAYEHGYNIKKVHYLILGDRTVHWSDYLLPQTRSNKQLTLLQLSQNKDNFIILNHPDMRNGIENDDVKYLSNYHGMEVSSPYSNSVAKWDIALSAGRPIFLIGSDDVHNVFNRKSVGRFCTMVNIKEPDQKNVLAALKFGQSYGIEIPEIENEEFVQKIIRLKSIPQLVNCSIKENNIQLVLNKIAKEIIFIGQHGKILSRKRHSRIADYQVQESDHYVRITIIFDDGIRIYMNPIFRYKEEPLIWGAVKIDYRKSLFFGVLGNLILLSWGLFLLHFFMKSRMKSLKLLPLTGFLKLPLRINYRSNKSLSVNVEKSLNL